MKIIYPDNISPIFVGDEKLRLGYIHEGPRYFKIIAVTLLECKKVYYFFENDLLDIIESDDDDSCLDTPTYFNEIPEFEQINPLIISTAIEQAYMLNSIAIYGVKPNGSEQLKEGYYRSYNLETNLGVLTIGFGVINKVSSSLNCLVGWPMGIVINSLKVFDTNDYTNIKKGLLFSLIGLDNLLYKSAPAPCFIDPLSLDYKKA